MDSTARAFHSGSQQFDLDPHVVLEPGTGNISDAAQGAMPERSCRVWQFLFELRQRKVCRAALLYAMAVWVIFQIAQVVFDALRFPDWVLSFVVVTAVLGFPIAVILAWVFEVTPAGLVLDIPVADKGANQCAKRDTCWNILLLAASILISFQMFSLGSGEIGVDHDRAERLESAESIVVIPFRAASVNLETKAYAFSLSEQLRHLLRTDFGLKVIAVDTIENVDNSRKRADLILEGSVAITRDAARVIVHLVDSRDGHDLWSDAIHISDIGTNNSIHQFTQEILSALPIGRKSLNNTLEKFAANGLGEQSVPGSYDIRLGEIKPFPPSAELKK